MSHGTKKVLVYSGNKNGPRVNKGPVGKKCPTGQQRSCGSTKVLWEQNCPGTGPFPQKLQVLAPGPSSRSQLQVLAPNQFGEKIMLPGFISQIISRLDPGPLEIYRERYSCWNYYILEKVYIILLLNPKKNFFPQTIAITSVQQFLKKK